MFVPQKTLIIAEIGTAHGGKTEMAKKLIDAAADAGADCVKFQIVYADEILHPDTGFVTLPGGNIRLYDRFKELEVPPDFYRTCRIYAEQRGILFCASPFGIRSLHELWELKPFAIKIASPELNHMALLRSLSELERHSRLNEEKTVPVILSSGVSKAADIENALEQLEDVANKTLLHCVTSYPAPETDYNLHVLKPLSVLFGIPCGVSDHSLHPYLVPALAVACGATIIEKHICLSKEGGGLDDPVALPPDAFAHMVGAVRQAEQNGPEQTLKKIKSEFGKEYVTAVLGTGKKKLGDSEAANYTRTNRSLHFTRNMNTGETITDADIAVLRTEKILTPGIGPEFEQTVLGAVLTHPAKNGEGVQWSHIIKKQGLPKKVSF